MSADYPPQFIPGFNEYIADVVEKINAALDSRQPGFWPDGPFKAIPNEAFHWYLQAQAQRRDADSYMAIAAELSARLIQDPPGFFEEPAPTAT